MFFNAAKWLRKIVFVYTPKCACQNSLTLTALSFCTSQNITNKNRTWDWCRIWTDVRPLLQWGYVGQVHRFGPDWSILTTFGCPEEEKPSDRWSPAFLQAPLWHCWACAGVSFSTMICQMEGVMGLPLTTLVFSLIQKKIATEIKATWRVSQKCAISRQWWINRWSKWWLWRGVNMKWGESVRGSRNWQNVHVLLSSCQGK